MGRSFHGTSLDPGIIKHPRYIMIILVAWVDASMCSLKDKSQSHITSLRRRGTVARPLFGTILILPHNLIEACPYGSWQPLAWTQLMPRQSPAPRPHLRHWASFRHYSQYIYKSLSPLKISPQCRTHHILTADLLPSLNLSHKNSPDPQHSSILPRTPWRNSCLDLTTTTFLNEVLLPAHFRSTSPRNTSRLWSSGSRTRYLSL